MPEYLAPGVYVEEVSFRALPVAQVETAIPAFIGCTANGPKTGAGGKVVPVVRRISSLREYETHFGGRWASSFVVTTGNDPQQLHIDRVRPVFDYIMHDCVSLYFSSGGGPCFIVSVGSFQEAPTPAQFEAGLAALEKEDEPTLVLLSEAVGLGSDYYPLAQKAMAHCASQKNRFAILDVESVDSFRKGIGSRNLSYGAAYYPFLETSLTFQYDEDQVTVQGPAGRGARNLSELKTSNPGLYKQVKSALEQQRVVLPPSPAVTGVYVRPSSQMGVWKAPANVSLDAVIGPVAKISSAEQERLNAGAAAGKTINTLRTFSGVGTLVLGALTLAGNDNEWRFVPVFRLLAVMEESVRRAVKLAVFKADDPAAWRKVKAALEDILSGLWKQGALVGTTPEQAYFVHLGQGRTMSGPGPLEGQLLIETGAALVQPAEFITLRVVLRLDQESGEVGQV
jgi:uncharacterized protein